MAQAQAEHAIRQFGKAANLSSTNRALTINKLGATRHSSTSSFFLSFYSYNKLAAGIHHVSVKRHPNSGSTNCGEHPRHAEFPRGTCRSQQGWFEFSAPSGGRKVDGVSIGDFTILSHLQVGHSSFRDYITIL
jgi:hypothetical protein